MRKRLIFTFIASILLISMFTALVSAQDASEPNLEDTGEEVYEDTQYEVEAMDNAPGVEMRLLQLERAIQRVILQMDRVITVLSENGTDVSELEGFKAEMQVLLEEVQAIESPEVNQETIDKFIQIKEDGREIAGKFKEAAAGYITSDLRDSLRAQFREMERSRLKDLTDQIQEKRKEYHANRAEKLMNSLGDREDALLQRIREGNITSDQIKSQLRERLNNLSVEEKRAAAQRIADQARERVLERADRIANATMARLEIKASRLQDRAVILEDRGFLNASLRLEDRASILRVRNQNIEMNLEKIKTNVQQRIADRRAAQ